MQSPMSGSRHWSPMAQLKPFCEQKPVEQYQRAYCPAGLLLQQGSMTPALEPGTLAPGHPVLVVAL
jgi:hypothetical protein